MSKKRRILVVEDNPTSRKLACDILSWAGYEVVGVGDAELALRVLGKASPDMVLMDIGLPGMDGLSLARKIKAAALTAHIKIVALTAFAMKADEQKARDAGCDGYITKPIDTRTFAGQVTECFDPDESA